MIFKRTKKDIDIKSLILMIRQMAEGRLGDIEIEEFLTILNREFLETRGVTLYAYADNGELQSIGSTYGSDNPVWIEAQQKALNAARKNEYNFGAKREIGKMLMENYISKKVDCATLPLSAGTDSYGYLLCDCEVGEGIRIRDKWTQWMDNADELGHIVYLSLVMLIRQVKMSQKIEGASSREASRTDFKNCIKRMGSFSILEVAIPDIFGLEGYEKILAFNELSSIMNLSFKGYSKVYLLSEGVYAGAFENSGEATRARLRAIDNLVAYYSKKDYQPGYIVCKSVSDRFIEAMYTCERQLDELMPRKIYSFSYDAVSDSFKTLIDASDIKEGYEIVEEDVKESIVVAPDNSEIIIEAEEYNESDDEEDETDEMLENVSDENDDESVVADYDGNAPAEEKGPAVEVKRPVDNKGKVIPRTVTKRRG